MKRQRTYYIAYNSMARTAIAASAPDQLSGHCDDYETCRARSIAEARTIARRRYSREALADILTDTDPGLHPADAADLAGLQN